MGVTHFVCLCWILLYFLKEKKYGIAENEVATFVMKESLIRYIIENCGEKQVIIAENGLPEAVDYTKATMITFA